MYWGKSKHNSRIRSEVKLSKLNGMEKFSIDLKNDGMLLKIYWLSLMRWERKLNMYYDNTSVSHMVKYIHRQPHMLF